MAALSKALIEFANHNRPQPAPGAEIIVTPRYTITLQPDFPVPGPNSVSWIRCRPDEADELITEAHATIAPHRLPVMWTLDPETEPRNFGDYLMARYIHPDPHPDAAVMVLPIDAMVAVPAPAGLEIRDGLSDLATFRSADAVAAEAFMSDSIADSRGHIEMLERRRLNWLAAGNRHILLATVDGEPAGTAGLTVFAQGAIINGGSVRPKFRGRGVYRALVAARLEIARSAGVSGLAVWGGAMSAPILERLGFQTVGWRRFYLDTSTA